MTALAAIGLGDLAILGAFAANAIWSARRLKSAIASVIEREDRRHSEYLAALACVQTAIEAIDNRLAALEAKRNGGDVFDPRTHRGDSLAT